MILQRLAEHYDRIASNPENQLPRSGWSVQKISFCVVLNEDGTLHSFESLLEPDGRRSKPREMLVPGQNKPTGSAVTPCLLWDSSQYMLGYKANDSDPERTRKCFAAFRDFHLELESRFDHPSYRALCAFLRSWSPEEAQRHSGRLDEITKNFGVFRLAATTSHLHEQFATEFADLLDSGHEPASPEGMCLVTGRFAPIARLHEPKIKGVNGTQSAGALLVSFNAPAYESYNKEQSYNAPVSTDAAFKYANALNFLLKDGRRRISLGDTTVVFWAEHRHPLEEAMSDLMGEINLPEVGAEDEVRVQQTRRFLRQLRDGAVEDKALDSQSRTRFFILGLAPNASRISVRFWVEADVGELERRLGQHLRDLEIIHHDDRPLTLRDIARSTGRAEYRPDGRLKGFDNKSAPDQLVGELARSVLTGAAYPQPLLSAMLRRIRSDGEVHPARVAATKGYLLRNARLRGTNLEVSVELDEDQIAPPYRMGRLFALLEKIQTDSAESGLNSTIKDRYFSSASATPAVVFPRLFRLSQHHQAKLATGARIYYEKLLQETISGVNRFPAHLTLEDQGLFVIGYYHQRQKLYTRKSQEEGAVQ